MAIDFYESIENNKFVDYQDRLSELLTRPIVIKHMNDHVKHNDKKSSEPGDVIDKYSQRGLNRVYNYYIKSFSKVSKIKFKVI